FAGQHDSFLAVLGPRAVLEAVRRCWASLFTDRAVAYREHHGTDHSQVAMAVVVQQMVRADASGVLFTADPVSGERRVSTVEATLGLGEPLVSGRVDPGVFQVRDREVVGSSIADKEISLEAVPGGGTRGVPVGRELRLRPVLTEE